MNKKAVILDCDEILLDHLGGFKLFVEKYYDIKPEGTPVQYNLQDWLKCDSEKVMELIKNFNYFSYEFGLLKPVTLAVPALQRLVNNNPNVAFIVVTKSGTFGHGEVLRKVNLHNVFGDIFDDIIILEQYQSKRNAYNKLKNNFDIVTVVDDYLGNIDVAEELGLDAVVLDCPHNVGTLKANGTDYTRVKDWVDLFEYIQKKIESTSGTSGTTGM